MICDLGELDLPIVTPPKHFGEPEATALPTGFRSQHFGSQRLC